MLLYEEFGGRALANAFTAQLPLFYFSAAVENIRQAQEGINPHKAADAHAQRQAWQQWYSSSRSGSRRL